MTARQHLKACAALALGGATHVDGANDPREFTNLSYEESYSYTLTLLEDGYLRFLNPGAESSSDITDKVGSVYPTAKGFYEVLS